MTQVNELIFDIIFYGLSTKGRVKKMGKMMLSKSVFLCVLSGVKITLKNPNISWIIFNFKPAICNLKPVMF